MATSRIVKFCFVSFNQGLVWSICCLKLRSKLLACSQQSLFLTNCCCLLTLPTKCESSLTLRTKLRGPLFMWLPMMRVSRSHLHYHWPRSNRGYRERREEKRSHNKWPFLAFLDRSVVRLLPRDQSWLPREIISLNFEKVAATTTRRRRERRALRWIWGRFVWVRRSNEETQKFRERRFSRWKSLLLQSRRRCYHWWTIQ